MLTPNNERNLEFKRGKWRFRDKSGKLHKYTIKKEAENAYDKIFGEYITKHMDPFLDE